jgi:hypothetical protein
MSEQAEQNAAGKQAVTIEGGGQFSFLKNGMLAWTEPLIIRGLRAEVAPGGTYTFPPSKQVIPLGHYLLARGRRDQPGLAPTITPIESYVPPKTDSPKFDLTLARRSGEDGSLTLLSFEPLRPGGSAQLTGPVELVETTATLVTPEPDTAMASREVHVVEESFLDDKSPVTGRQMTVEEVRAFEHRMNTEGVKDPESFTMLDGVTTLAQYRQGLRERAQKRRAAAEEELRRIQNEEAQKAESNVVVAVQNRSGVVLVSTPANDRRDVASGGRETEAEKPSSE